MEKWREEVLAHHGILGQKWGKRNGPPYPLNPVERSSAEKSKNGSKYTKSGMAAYADSKLGLTKMTDTGTGGNSKGSGGAASGGNSNDESRLPKNFRNDMSEVLKNNPDFKFKSEEEFREYLSKTGVTGLSDDNIKKMYQKANQALDLYKRYGSSSVEDGGSVTEKGKTSKSSKSSKTSKGNSEKGSIEDGKPYFDEHYPLDSAAWKKLKKHWLSYFNDIYMEECATNLKENMMSEKEAIDMITKKIFSHLSSDKIPMEHLKDFYRYAKEYYQALKLKEQEDASIYGSKWKAKRTDAISEYVNNDSKILDEDYEFPKNVDNFEKYLGKIGVTLMENAPKEQVSDLYDSLREYHSNWINTKNKVVSTLLKKVNKDNIPNTTNELEDIMVQNGMYKKGKYTEKELDNILRTLKSVYENQSREPSKNENNPSKKTIIVRHDYSNKDGIDFTIAHHGRLGQRWGIRNGPSYPLSRDQLSSFEKREDNSLFDSARERYGTDGVSSNQKSKSKSGLKTVDLSKVTDESLSGMSNSELNSFINRKNLEENFKRLITLSEKDPKKYYDIVSDALNSLSSYTGLAASFTGLKGVDKKITIGLTIASIMLKAGSSGVKLAGKTSEFIKKEKENSYKSSLDLSNISDKELQEIINRLNLENNYKKLSNIKYSNNLDISNELSNIIKDYIAVENTKKGKKGDKK